MRQIEDFQFSLKSKFKKTNKELLLNFVKKIFYRFCYKRDIVPQGSPSHRDRGVQKLNCSKVAYGTKIN